MEDDLAHTVIWLGPALKSGDRARDEVWKGEDSGDRAQSDDEGFEG